MSEHIFNDRLEEFSYALGISIADNLANSGVNKLDINNFAQGITDFLQGGKLKIDPSKINDIFQDFMAEQQAGDTTSNLEEGLLFLAENLNDPNVVETPSGLQYKILKKGNGPKPSAGNSVKCHYHGTLINGNVFDSSVQRGTPAVFPVGGVIQGWVEALQMMNTGSKWRLFIPPDLAYGKQGAGGSIGPDTTLIFDVELIDIV